MIFLNKDSQWVLALPPMIAESLLTPSGITLSSFKGNSASEDKKGSVTVTHSNFTSSTFHCRKRPKKPQKNNKKLEQSMTHSCCFCNSKVKAEHGVGGWTCSWSLFDRRGTDEMRSASYGGDLWSLFHVLLYCSTRLTGESCRAVKGFRIGCCTLQLQRQSSNCCYSRRNGRKSGWTKVTALSLEAAGFDEFLLANAQLG